MNKEPKVTIILVNWNGLNDTCACLESLEKINYSNYSVIVVDNNSANDEIIHLKKRFEYLKIVSLKQNLGFAIANNVGIRIALNSGSDYVLLLNNDTVVQKNFLQELVNIGESKSIIGITSPKIYCYEDKNRISCAGGKLNMYLGHRTLGLFKYDKGQYEQVQEMDWLSGACLLIKKIVFEKTGLLPREYFLSWEDIDFCVSARSKGFSCVYVPTSHIWHKTSASFKRHNLNDMQIFYGFRNRVMIRYKFLSKKKFFIFLLCQSTIVVPIHMLFYTLKYRDFKKINYALTGFIRGIRDMKTKKTLYEPLNLKTEK